MERCLKLIGAMTQISGRGARVFFRESSTGIALFCLMSPQSASFASPVASLCNSNVLHGFAVRNQLLHSSPDVQNCFCITLYTCSSLLHKIASSNCSLYFVQIPTNFRCTHCTTQHIVQCPLYSVQTLAQKQNIETVCKNILDAGETRLWA